MDLVVWIILGVVIGFVIGILCQHFVFSDGTEQLKTSQQLKNLQKEYHEYQLKVSDHLKQTTSLISTIQTHYDEVQSHLFSAAQELNKSDARQNLFQPHSHYVTYGPDHDLDDHDHHNPMDPHHENQKPPKDYA
mgnify:CR=1 FL=1